MSRSKVIFVDDITSYDYGFSYSDLHKSNDNLTYIVFSEYEGFKEINHGDIYYNGEKITFINDIDNSKIVSDGFSHYMPYVNSDNNISLTRSYIYLEREDGTQIDTTYTIFPNNESIDITYKHYSDFDKYVDVIESYWGDTIIKCPNDQNMDLSGCGERNGVITLDDYGNNCVDVTLSYNYNINDEWYEDTFAIKLRKPVYPKKVHFLYDVELSSTDFVYLPANSYYEPKISVSPALADSYTFVFSISNSNLRDSNHFNTKTGRVFLDKPGEKFTISCSYKTSASESSKTVTSDQFYISPVNPHLSLVSSYTTYLWSNTNYNKTTCYLQSNLIDPSDVTLGVYKSSGTTIRTSTNHYINVLATDLDSNNLVIVKAEIKDAVKDKYNKDLRSCAIKLYGENNLYTESELAIQDVSDVVNGTATFILSDTNITADYNIESDDEFVTATITNIVKSGSKIYTYVTVSGISNFKTIITITPSNSNQTYTLELYNTSNTNININHSLHNGHSITYIFN